MKTQFFHNVTLMLSKRFFILRPSDLITTLTNILLDNFCPCFLLLSNFEIVKIVLKIKELRVNKYE